MGESFAKNPLRNGSEVEMVEPGPSEMVDTYSQGNACRAIPLVCSLRWGVKIWKLLGTIRWFTQPAQALQMLHLQDVTTRSIAAVGIGGS